jgi:hypothetical protein
MNAPLQIPALEIADRGSAEVKIDKLAHFPSLRWPAPQAVPPSCT